jgi:hypothetical protein
MAPVTTVFAGQSGCGFASTREKERKVQVRRELAFVQRVPAARKSQFLSHRLHRSPHDSRHQLPERNAPSHHARPGAVNCLDDRIRDHLRRIRQ